jgi:hypothetical protein
MHSFRHGGARTGAFPLALDPQISGLPLVWCSGNTMKKSKGFRRHCRESGNPDFFEFRGFRVALPIASLPGMTVKFSCELLGQDARLAGC